MKKAFFAISFLILIMNSQTIAQSMQRMGLQSPGIQQLVMQYGDDLQLTDDQKEELIALQIEHRNQFRSDRRGYKADNNRGSFRRDRNKNGQRFNNTGNRGIGVETRMKMRNEVWAILTNEQQELLKSKMIEQAEKAHDFSTFRHEVMVQKAGIEGEKANLVLNLLNAQSETRLEVAKQRILKPEEMNRDQFADLFQQIQKTDNELRSILTVDEYDSLRKNMGFRNQAARSPQRGYRMWSR